METPSQLLAQCIQIGVSQICGPFPTPGCNPATTVGCGTNAFATPGDVISRVMEYAFPFAGIILLFVVILSGYQLIVSGGESAKIQAAGKRITYGLLGFGLLIVSYVVVKTLSYILGFDSPL